MNNQFLPIGTVVKLINDNNKIVIIGYLMKNKQGYTYDYCGCIYPIGVTDKRYNYYFNKSDIVEVKKLGLVDKETKGVLNRINLAKLVS